LDIAVSEEAEPFAARESVLPEDATEFDESFSFSFLRARFAKSARLATAVEADSEIGVRALDDLEEERAEEVGRS
jgi:hypothetical protein